jgi:hypothetical protein
VAIAFDEDAAPASQHSSSRAGATLYGRIEQKWLKLDERDVGGSPEKGEFGAFNRQVGG